MEWTQVKKEEQVIPVVLLQREKFLPTTSDTPGGRKKSENRAEMKKGTEDERTTVMSMFFPFFNLSHCNRDQHIV